MGRILSFDEFQDAYLTEAACWNKLVKNRWPGGFECPRCGCKRHGFIATRNLFRCCQCRYQCSAIVGTVMQDTKLPLRTWFWAMFLYATTKKSISACELQRKLGLGSYETALLLHWKIQHAFRKVNKKLRGLVEVDEAFLGPVSRGTSGRGTGKALVAIAVEDRGEHAGRMAASPVMDAGKESLGAFVAEHVQPGDEERPGTIVRTDGHAGYEDLDALGYQHAPEVLGDPTRAMEVLPLVHEIAGNLRRMLDGTHAGRVSKKHLAGYLDAFEFRYDRRGFLGKALAHAIVMVVHCTPWPYKLAIR